MPTQKNFRKELADKTAKEYFLEQSAACVVLPFEQAEPNPLPKPKRIYSSIAA